MDTNRSERLTILLTKDEMWEIRRRAGLIPISVWVRAQVFTPNSSIDKAVEAVKAWDELAERASVEEQRKWKPGMVEQVEAYARNAKDTVERREPKVKWSKELNIGVSVEPKVTPEQDPKELVEWARKRKEELLQEEKPRLEKQGKLCAHGVKKGWHCWQCGGMAKIGDEKD